MLSPNDRVLKERYLQKYIYNDLENMNVGFDTPSIRYFKESDFAKVLERVEKCGIGIYGIEPHFYNATSESIEFFSVDTFESYSSYPQDSKWYKAGYYADRGHR
jgi:hypothetical protein